MRSRRERVARGLSGLRVLLTGASSGIGLHLARLIAGVGGTLALAARRESELVRLAEEIADAHWPRPAVLPVDLSAPGQARGLADRAMRALGGVDILVNNAGCGMHGELDPGSDSAEARALFETNFWAPMALTSALVPHMRASGGGLVVNVSSVAAVAGMARAGHYAASKAALSICTEVLRLELATDPIDVVHVLLGPTDTRLLDQARHAMGERALRFAPTRSPELAARRIVRAMEKRESRVVYPAGLALSCSLPGVARLFSRLTSRQLDPPQAAAPTFVDRTDPGSAQLPASWSLVGKSSRDRTNRWVKSRIRRI